jgi:signal peptidase I
MKVMRRKLNKNDSGPDGIFKMICRGPSMYPTLQLFDILHVRPYNGRELLSGDVIVFTPPGSCTPVAHRVISYDAGSIETRGDNNDLADPYSTTAGAVIGRVVYAQRGKGLRRIYGGVPGRLVGRVRRIRRVILQWLCLLFRPIYHRAARSGVLRRLIPAGVKQSVVAFESHGETLLQLYLGRVPVGKYIPELRAWRIRPPFRLFVDEKLLADPSRLAIKSLK